MHNFARRQMVAIWVALAAVLFGALAPALSHALPAAGRGAEQVQVCTMEGMRTIAVAHTGPDAPSGPGAPADASFLKHCPYCAAHGSPFPPPGAQPALPAPVPASVHPPLFHRPPGPLSAWTSAHPRAPPPSV